MTGKYLEMQMNGYIVRPILAFREYIFSDVLPAFNNISERADKLGDEMYQRIGAQPAYDDSYDMADAAEAAQDYSLSWYEMMVSLRQTMRNLLATGLFHLAEQQIAKLTQDAGFMVPRPKNTNLIEVAKWFKEYMHLDLVMLQSWPLMDELRLVANTVKHAAGYSAEELFQVNRALFSNPDYEEIDEEFRQHGVEPTFGPVAAPMAGEDLFVSEKLLKIYVEGVLAFFKEIADYFERHGDDFF